MFYKKTLFLVRIRVQTPPSPRSGFGHAAGPAPRAPQLLRQQPASLFTCHNNCVLKIEHMLKKWAWNPPSPLIKRAYPSPSHTRKLACPNRDSDSPARNQACLLPFGCLIRVVGAEAQFQSSRIACFAIPSPVRSSDKIGVRTPVHATEINLNPCTMPVTRLHTFVCASPLAGKCRTHAQPARIGLIA